MVKYITTSKFNILCKNFDGDERLNKLAKNLAIPYVSLSPHKEKINKILDFVKDIDTKCHEFIEEDDKVGVFFAHTIHSHIPSDIRSMMILAITEQHYQLNIILRHFVESFVVTLWGDVIPQFRDSLDYILGKRWKEFRNMQRMTWDYNKNFPHRSVKERLARIRLINQVSLDGREFYHEYFSKCSSCDVILLFSLSICTDCKKNFKGRVDFNDFHLDPKVRSTGREDEHAIYKTDFGLQCAFCNKQKETEGFAVGIPEPSDMLDMLIPVTNDELSINFAMLRKLYNYLSENYVHFSPTSIDTAPKLQDFDGKKGFIWGFDGILFAIDMLNPIMKYYFEKLEERIKNRRDSSKS